MPELSQEKIELFHQVAMLPAEKRFSLFEKLALEGFVITIVLSQSADGKLNESITFDIPYQPSED
ncbi:MAG: hypothetical protein P4L50_15910 [Anaerolineaceae bacterium]|nr:hypothetical protein [Anaerolineaceae bacterium]